MKFGKAQIHDLPISDITTLGAYADQLQLEYQTRNEPFPPAARLHIGEPDFRTPEHIRQAAIESLATEMQTYGAAAGRPWLRELLAEKIARVNGYRIQPTHTAIGMGGTGVIQATLLATVGPGDEVLLPDPCWPHYTLQLAACGATGVPYPLDPQNEWLPDLERMEQLITPRTRLLIINSPGNPTGTVFPQSMIQQLLEFASRHDLYLLSDECYDQMIFEGQHLSPASLLSTAEFEDGRVISAYTFSKTYAMTGWRLGYVVASTQMIKTITDVLNAGLTNVSTAIQRAGAAALTGPQECVAMMREAYRRRRDLAVSLLRDFDRYVYTPHGAFYVLIDIRQRNGEPRDGREFALELVRQCNITVTPGYSFGAAANDYVRVSLAADDKAVERGVREICRLANL